MLSPTTAKEWYRSYNNRDFNVEEHREGCHKSGPKTDKRREIIQEAFRKSRY